MAGLNVMAKRKFTGHYERPRRRFEDNIKMNLKK
jgi:hypothetical protein